MTPAADEPKAAVHLEEARKHLLAALDLWQVDPDDDTPDRVAAWAALLDLAEDLQKIIASNGPCS